MRPADSTKEDREDVIFLSADGTVTVKGSGNPIMVRARICTLTV